MDKTEFKELFTECFELQLATGWNGGNSFHDWCLFLRLIDKETGSPLLETEIPLTDIRE